MNFLSPELIIVTWQEEKGMEHEWLTPERIPVKSVYTREDLTGMEHLNYAAGIAPFLRGPYSGMYAMHAMDYQTICRIFNS